MNLLTEFKQYEQSILSAKAAYKKYERLFLADGEISAEEHETLNQLFQNFNRLEERLDNKRLEQTIAYVREEVAKGEAKSTVHALNILGETLAKVSRQCQDKANQQLEAIYALAEPVIANLSVDNAKTKEHSCGDYWGGGSPFIRVCYYSASCAVPFPNLDMRSRTPYVGEWVREDPNYALFEDFSELISYRMDRIYKPVEWLGLALGLSDAHLETYTGLRVRYRIKGETILLHHWYGKFKYDLRTQQRLAVDFKGTGEDHLVLGAPLVLEYGLFDHNGNLVGSFEEKQDPDLGIDIDSYTVLPEESSGTF